MAFCLFGELGIDFTKGTQLAVQCKGSRLRSTRSAHQELVSVLDD